jgi:hypothetical protein
VVNGKATVSANILLLCAYSDYSVNSSYSVFYSVYSVILINSANTLVYSVLLCVLNSFYSVYSVDIVIHSDLLNFLYSVLLFINCISRLLGELNGIELDIVSWSTLRIVINSSILYV